MPMLLRIKYILKLYYKNITLSNISLRKAILNAVQIYHGVRRLFICDYL